MPQTHPLTASGSRDLKRPRRIPQDVRDAIRLMVYGRPDDPDCAPIGFIEAAKDCGIKPDVMRRYLDRGDVRALLLAERRAFRTAICASNELALLKVRDTSANGMCVVASVRQLEELNCEQPGGARGGMPQQAGFVIQIVNYAPPAPIAGPASPSLTIIDASPSPPGQAGPPAGD
jgi:hypothetical protein